MFKREPRVKRQVLNLLGYYYILPSVGLSRIVNATIAAQQQRLEMRFGIGGISRFSA
jgi:hypothetical protein